MFLASMRYRAVAELQSKRWIDPLVSRPIVMA